MDSIQITEKLKELSSDGYKANVIRFGIPEQNCLGVPTPQIRKLAKTIEKSNRLAYDLWDTGYHEARLLAALLFTPESFSLEKADNLMSQVVSWDLCDFLCTNFLSKLDDNHSLIVEWGNSQETYKKRAAFSLMAINAIHNQDLSVEAIDEYLQIIFRNSNDERVHVKKAVSWALREIGKRNPDYQEKAIILAYELLASKNKSQMWIAKDAIKELETLVKVKQRGRLLSSKTKMGKEHNL